MANTDNNHALTRYSKGAIAFHWIIALLVIANIFLFQYSDYITEGLEGQAAREINKPYMDLHKAFGISILFLTIGRLWWRWTHSRPALSEHLASWEKLLARTTHAIFYILLLGLPLGGWLWMSSYGAPISFFGLFNVPLFPVQGNEFLQQTLGTGHEIGGKIIMVLVALHILGAMKHQFVDKIPFLQRMWP